MDYKSEWANMTERTKNELKELRKSFLKRIINSHNGSLTETAKELGWSRQYVKMQIDRLGLTKEVIFK